MWRTYIRSNRWTSPWASQVERHPGWVAKTALVAALLVIVLPLALLFFTAVLVGVVVFAVLSLTVRLKAWLGGVFRAGSLGDGRRNVRVIARQDP
ncbi:MAG: hypothetical protein IT443_05285 [Phycisphaeraceae bacterium]|nr:hypothetical protein [Phycisphaeraceae bacterium]